ncbi:DUF6931 family protein [Methylocaldum sp.]|uniref:DUF6931 family protein n=1 Tax=Methylocaldum sp. TaxID=1969727 RepID=UPI002D4D67AE|nr:hypothetical protein [Methylocaldum sp.]HYE35614.1 hypothetical protein [Methylocaldum sp.]
MTEYVFTKVTAPRAASVCQDIDLDEAARRLLSPEGSPADFLRLLMENALYPDAVKFLARALPKRESTWWACLCARTALGDGQAPEALKPVELAEQWVYKPSEEHRRLAFTAAEAHQFQGPASWAAMAAFWSGGSMAPPEAPAVPPADNLTGKAVAGAVMLAAVQVEPEKAPAKYRRFLEQGIDIACGGNGRLDSKPAAPHA